MKRWRVVQFASADEAERFLNGLGIEPDQVKGLFANPTPPADGSGNIVLVCWLNTQQQRFEALQQRPRTNEDVAPADPGTSEAIPPRAPPSPGEPRASRRRDDDELT